MNSARSEKEKLSISEPQSDKAQQESDKQKLQQFETLCTQLQVLYELSPQFVDKRIARVKSDDEKPVLLKMQSFIKSVKESELTFKEWCSYIKKEDKGFIVDCGNIIQAESTYLQQHNQFDLEEEKHEDSSKSDKEVKIEDDPFKGLEDLSDELTLEWRVDHGAG